MRSWVWSSRASLSDLDEALTLTVYRVVQEGLNNVAKHSSAQEVTLNVARNERDVVLAVNDDGVGADTEAPTTGLGLIGMRERVAALGGRLEVTSERGRGFELSARIPVSALS